MLRKFFLLFLLTLAIMTSAVAFDQSDKTALGLTGGKVVPFGDNAFNDQADGLWAYGGYIRRHFNPNWGMDLAFTRQDYDKICSCTRSNILDALAFYRLKGAEDISPIIGIGLGLVENSNHQNLHLGIRARAGIEKALINKFALGAHLDYQSVRKMPGSSHGPIPSEIHTLVPKLELSWYFGNE